MKRMALCAALLMLSLGAAAKGGYRFTLQVDGSKDSMLIVGYYYAESLRVLDTAFNNGRGKFVFEGDRELQPGMYYFTDGRGRFVDFVVYHEKPVFKFHTDDRDWKRNMEVSGSQQNTLFFNFNRSTEALYAQIDAAQAEMDSAAFLDFRNRILKRVDTVRLDFIARHPDAMLSRLMKATKDPDMPPDSLKGNDRYFHFMHHYFDNVPLDDDFIIRTPRMVFYNRVNDYVEKHMQGLSPEMAIPLLDTLIDRSQPAQEVYKWLVLRLTEKYLQSHIMVYDEIYVHLVQRYFATGKVPFLSPSVIDEQVTRATKWERLLVGREAPELILFDTTRRVWSLHHMPGRYTLLLFWSPTCGHCRTIIPEIYKVFERMADSVDMTAFAILSEPEEHTIEKWKKFLADHGMTHPRWINLNGGEANVDWREVYDIETTPQIYLIENETHKFIAKKLDAALLETICKQL